VIYLTLPNTLSGVKFDYGIRITDILQLNPKQEVLERRVNLTRISLMVLYQLLAGRIKISGHLVSLRSLFDLLLLLNARKQQACFED
jgi:hypothetical protein